MLIEPFARVTEAKRVKEGNEGKGIYYRAKKFGIEGGVRLRWPGDRAFVWRNGGG